MHIADKITNDALRFPSVSMWGDFIIGIPLALCGHRYSRSQPQQKKIEWLSWLTGTLGKNDEVPERNRGSFGYCLTQWPGWVPQAWYSCFSLLWSWLPCGYEKMWQELGHLLCHLCKGPLTWHEDQEQEEVSSVTGLTFLARPSWAIVGASFFCPTL